MSNKTKIYCILLDSAPFVNDFRDFGKENKMHMMRQVGGCFTGNSVIEMLTGKSLSDLRPHGIGHLTHYKNEDANHKIQWPWQKDLLINILFEKGWDIEYYNGDIDWSVILSDNTAFRKTVTDHATSELMLPGKEPTKFYKQEKKYVKNIQKRKNKKHTFHLFKYIHYQAAINKRRRKGEKKFKIKRKIAMQRLFKMLKYWNFNEPDALFWIFSDHGDWTYPYNMIHPYPQNYFTWALCRDNTKNALNIQSNFISIKDFFATIMNKFDYFHKDRPDICSIETPQNKNRIYYAEDGRKDIDDDISTTAMACNFIDWEKDYPTSLMQTSYHSPANEWQSHITKLDKESFAGETVKLNTVNVDLKEAVRKKFSWT